MNSSDRGGMSRTSARREARRSIIGDKSGKGFAVAVLRTLLILAANLILVALVPFRTVMRYRAKRRVRWVALELEGAVHFLSPRKSVLRRLLRARHHAPYVTLRGLERSIDAALELPNVTGFVVKVRRIRGGWAAVDALREDLGRIVRAGKSLVVHLPEGGSLRELFVASAGTKIVVAPESTLTLGGLSIEARYVKGALDRLGVEVEVHRRAEFKSAAEFVSADTMSEESRTQLTELLESFYGAVVEAVAASRGMSHAATRALLDQPLLRPAQALDAGLVDALAYEDELPSLLEPDGSPPKLVAIGRARRLTRSRLLLPFTRPPRLALIRVEGTIVDSESSRAGLPHLREAVRRARAERSVRGVLVVVDSPGGSAHASDLLHRELVRLREKKPVLAFFADVAASGGYYLGVGAQEIVAGRLTITGSIGVLAARVAAVDLMSRIGVLTEVVRTGPHADLFGPHRRTTEAERALFEEHIEAHYRAFVGKVAEGRGRPPEEIEPVARGRVYTGAAAHDLGLVDTLGGLSLAVRRLAERAGVPDRLVPHVELVQLPQRTGTAEVPEPPSPVRTAARALGLGPLADLLIFAQKGESMLYYAPGLPIEAESVKEER
jgi:protease IV